MKLSAKLLYWTAAILLLSVLACNKKPQPPEPAGEHLVQTVVPPPQSVVQKTFTVQKYESFELQVPAHCLRPRLHGDFRSFRYGEQGNRASDEAASVDVLLLDEQQFNDFVHGTGDATTRTVQAAHEQQIDWALRSTFFQTQKYYLVFNNSTGKPKIKIVEADMTLSFD